MKVTDCAIHLAGPGSGRGRLLAFARIVLDGSFAVDDLKVIDGPAGVFVAMPSRKLTGPCPRCGGPNHRLASFCNDCGGALDPGRGPVGEDGRMVLHGDVCHPIHARCREAITAAVLAAYEVELARPASDPAEPSAVPFRVRLARLRAPAPGN
jgi:stage V sporulation protein G